MNLCPAPLVIALVFAAVALAPALVAQDASAPAGTTVRVRRPLFTEAEMERFRVLAAEQEARRESYIRASDDDEVILLDPYFVEGDNSLLLARIRRALERANVGRDRIFVGLDETTRQELMFARRGQDEFFQAGSVGRPSDAPNFDGIDLVKLPQKLLPKNLRELFRAPPEKVGE